GPPLEPARHRPAAQGRGRSRRRRLRRPRHAAGLEPRPRDRPRRRQRGGTVQPGALGRHRRTHPHVRLARGARRRHRAGPRAARRRTHRVAADLGRGTGGRHGGPRRPPVAPGGGHRSGQDRARHRSALAARPGGVRARRRPGGRGVLPGPAGRLPRRPVRRHRRQARRRPRPGRDPAGGGHRHHLEAARRRRTRPDRDRVARHRRLPRRTGRGTARRRRQACPHAGRLALTSGPRTVRKPVMNPEPTPAGRPDVLVVGGGIGGLGAAFALSRQGLRVRVLERAPAFGEVGAGLQIAPNCTRILDEYGLLDEARTLGVVPDGMVMRDALDSSELTRLDLRDLERRYGFPYMVIHRSDLHGIFLRACERAGVELLTDRTVVDYEQTEDGALVRLADGSTEEAPLVIAADGLNSVARTKLIGDDVVSSSYVAYRAAVPIEQVRDNGVAENDVTVYIGPRCHFVQYALRGGEMFNQVAVFESP